MWHNELLKGYKANVLEQRKKNPKLGFNKLVLRAKLHIMVASCTIAELSSGYKNFIQNVGLVLRFS